MNETAPALFTVDELWLIRAVVRHEMDGQERWKLPPASRDLNAKVATALLLCEECRVGDAALDLSWGDTFVLDYCVPQDAKGVDGEPLGRSVLLKAYRARSVLEYGGDTATAEEPQAPSAAEVAALIEQMEREVWPWQRRQRPQRYR